MFDLFPLLMCVFILQVAMAKVAWLEEHRVTRQTAIDNAVRLAEAELRRKMEEELEEKLRQRLEQGTLK